MVQFHYIMIYWANHSVVWFSIYSVLWCLIFGRMVFIYSVARFRSNIPVSFEGLPCPSWTSKFQISYQNWRKFFRPITIPIRWFHCQSSHSVARRNWRENWAKSWSQNKKKLSKCLSKFRQMKSSWMFSRKADLQGKKVWLFYISRNSLTIKYTLNNF